MSLRPSLKPLLRLLLLAMACGLAWTGTANGAITYVAGSSGTASYAWGGSGNLTINRPAGTQAGDVLVLSLRWSGVAGSGWSDAGPDAQSPAWTEVRRDSDLATYYLVVPAGNPANYRVASWAFTGRVAQLVGVISGFRGVDTTMPVKLSATAEHAGSSGSTAAVSIPTATVTKAGSMRFSAVSTDATPTTAFSALTGILDIRASISVATAYDPTAVNPTTAGARTATLSGANDWVSQTVILRAAPTTPTITGLSPSAGPTGGGTAVVITGTDFTGATGVTVGGVAASYTVNNDGQITVTTPAGAVGSTDIRVTTALGTSANTAADDFTYHSPPTVTAISPSAGPTAGGTSVTITGTGFGGLSGAAAVTFGGVNATSYTVDSATQITATAPARAAGNADVRVTTPGGTSANTAADNYTYQAVPTVTSLAPSSGPEAGGNSITVTGSGFANLSGASAVRVGGADATSYTVNSTTSITVTVPAGTGTQDVRVTTPGGTSANTAADNYTYYAIPTLTAISPTSGPAAGGTTVTITGTGFGGLSGAAAVQFGGTNAASYVVNNATQITATAPAGTGTQDVRVTTPGGTTANTAADDYTYMPLPTVTSLSPSSGPTAGATTVTITGTGFTGATLVTFGGTNATGYTVNSSTQITATAPARAAGNADVRVTTSGGISANTGADDYTYHAPPMITSISPTSGPEAGGTSVTITGTNFGGLAGAAAVQFGGTNATGYTLNSATSITATAPAGTGVADIQVTTPGGSTANTAADDYTYVPLPTVTNLSPIAGPVGGGTTVTITGTNFSGASAVSFGGTAASGFSIINATTITATSPARAAGNADVRVTTAGGTSANTAADDYTYFPVPTITSISPMSGPAPGGTSVTITGTNLSGATAVMFGATSAASYTVNSATSISATAPPGTGTVDVRVTTPGGTTASTAADDFTYVPAPTVASLAPTSGPTAGGNTVTITGTTFTGATSVTFDGTNATGFTVVNATTITATAPAHAAGAADVRVTTPSGTSANTAADNYTYIATPTITNVSPASGASGGGTTATITGTGFTGTTQVSFGGTNATGYTVNSATQITATSPAHASGAVDVRVTAPGGITANTAADDYLYVDPPAISGISPSTGPASGGTLITITGSFFTGATQVQFGGTNAASFTVVNPTTITATAPAGTGVVSVRVTTPDGTSANTAADDFTYVAAPTVTGLAPSQGPDSGGTVVTITGTGFTGATAVTFGGTNATGFTILTPNTITATTPTHAAGVIDVTVTTPGGTSANTAADDYEFLAACGLGSLAASATDFSFLPITLDGLNRTQSTTANVQVSDMTGPGIGWKLEIGTTQFSAGAGKVLPANAATITSASSTPLGSSCSTPTSAVTYPIPLPLSPSKIKVYNAAAGTGLGPVDVELGVDLAIPANVQTGIYNSTFTIDLTAAP